MTWKICNSLKSEKMQLLLKPILRKYSLNKDSQLESVKIVNCLKQRDWKVSDIAQNVSGTGKLRIQKLDLSLAYLWENVVMSF